MLLLVPAVLLVTGYWQWHPLLSLAVPVAIAVVWRGAIRERRAERWLLYYVTGMYTYTILRALADDIGFPIQRRLGVLFDESMFLGVVPTVSLQRAWLIPSDLDWIDWSATAVHASFFAIPQLALLALWLKRPNALGTYVRSVLITLFIGLVAFILVPSTPPWLAARQAEISHTYRIIDLVLHRVDPRTYNDLYEALGEPNVVAAVPSIHMAVTFVILLFVRDHARRWVWPAAAYCLAMAFSLVYLGEHYVFDLLAGIAVAVFAYWVGAHRLSSSRGRPTPELATSARDVRAPVAR